LGLFRFSRDPRIWGVVLLSKFVLVFLGHVENYAWPYALSMWCIVLLRETTEAGRPSWPLWAVAVVATFCHPMVLMLWPALAWGLYPWDKRKGVEILVALLVTAGLADVLLFFGHAGGLPQEKWVLPLFDVGDSLVRYPFFSVLHWREVLGFHLTTMPWGLFLLALCGWRDWHGWRGALILAAGISVLWSLVWHPGMSGADWDLFAWPALFVNLAGGTAWVERSTEKRSAEAVSQSGQAVDEKDV